jgi:digalactosyldiacylglycerol synthase
MRIPPIMKDASRTVGVLQGCRAPSALARPPADARPRRGATDPGALVTEFIRTRTPLKLARRGSTDDTPASRAALREDGAAASDSEPSTSAASTPRFDLIVPWQILGPLPRLPWELPRTSSGGSSAASVGTSATSASVSASAGALDVLREAGEKEAGGGMRGGLHSLLRKRRRAAEERRKTRSVRDPGRSIAIVTTASLPWMTGTSVNPLLRAAYLARDGTRNVTLLLPWLAPSDQKSVHPGKTFASPAEQTEYVREWVTDRVGFEPNIKFTFYPGRWAPDKCSILPVGDITAYVPDSEADVAVLEEPEHLTWYHHGVRWTDKFSHVVGVVHTNYLEYARREENGGMKEAVLRFVNNWVVRAYCHKVVKLSDAVQELPRAQTCFVHGVSPRFLSIGEERARKAAAAASAAAAAAAAPLGAASMSLSAALATKLPSAADAATAAAAAPARKGVYFIGKVVWGKGYTELLDLVQKHCASPAGTPVSVDVFGGGDDLAAVRSSAEERSLPLHFMGPRDHADAALHDYSVFVNPSLSDVVATTTAEALAMGKWVVVAQHPSNAFFTGRFRNCLTYTTPEQFSAHLKTALTQEPSALNEAERCALSWEAATDRFMDVAEAEPRRRRPGAMLEGVADWAAAQVHQTLTGVEVRVSVLARVLCFFGVGLPCARGAPCLTRASRFPSAALRSRCAASPAPGQTRCTRLRTWSTGDPAAGRAARWTARTARREHPPAACLPAWQSPPRGPPPPPHVYMCLQPAL